MDWLQDNAWAAWLGLSMLLGVAELFSLDLILLMLAAGSLAGMATALIGAPVIAQALVAAAVSVAMIALVRPSVVRRLHGGPTLKHGPDLLIGEEGVALVEISAQSGQIKIAGEVWTARPYDSSAVISVGSTVQVFEVRGATAYVHEVPQLGS